MAVLDLERDVGFATSDNGSSRGGEFITEETSLLPSEVKPGSPSYQSTEESEDTPRNHETKESDGMGKSVLAILSLLMLGTIVN